MSETTARCTCGGNGICLACVLADLTREADALCATLDAGTDTLDALTAKHLPTESRKVPTDLLLVDPMAHASATLYDAAFASLSRKPFVPRLVD